MALSPLDPSFFLCQTAAGFVHLFSGRPDRALELAKRSIAFNPDWETSYSLLITAYTQLQRAPEAQAAVPKFLSLSHGPTISALRQRLPVRNPASLEMILEGFRKVGLPE